MQEDVELQGDTVVIPPASSAAPTGAEPARTMQKSRWRCGPASGCGRRTSGWPPAWDAPRSGSSDLFEVALFSTGDELREPGAPLGAGETYANRPILLGLLQASAAGSPTSASCPTGRTRWQRP